MARLGRNFRDGQRKLVGQAYSTKKISDMALYLSMGEAEAGAMAEGAGWGWDKGSGVVTPKQGREDMGWCHLPRSSSSSGSPTSSIIYRIIRQGFGLKICRNAN